MVRTILILGVLAAGCSSPYSYRRADPTPRSVLAGRGAVSGEARRELQFVDAVAVRARRAPSLSLTGLFGSRGGAAGATVAQVVPSAVSASERDKLVIEAWITMQADDVARTAAAVMARVEAAGGRVISSNLQGTDARASSAALELRVPPAETTAFTSWLGTQGVIESRRTLASDVGKLMFDQALAIQNLELTMSRLQKLIEKDVPVRELLEIEKEMTRVRGELEKIRGEQRWLADRVELATITLTIKREGGPIALAPTARIYASPRVAVLSLFDPDGRARTRLGGGASVHVHRYFTLDFDLFPDRGTDSRIALATAGTALYSNFLGGGLRRFLNPYLGLRVGYGYLSSESVAVVAAEAGLELLRHRLLLIDASVRSVAFFRDDHTDGALHATLGVGVPF